MFKHRLIVSETDFRIFAAIPTEHRILTWKKWRRPPDWDALHLIIEKTENTLFELGTLWTYVSEGYKRIAKLQMPKNLESVEESENEKGTRRLRGAQSVEAKILAGTCLEEAARCRELTSALTKMAVDSTNTFDDAVACSIEVRAFLDRVSSGVSAKSVDDLIDSSERHCDYYERIILGQNKKFLENLHVLGSEESTLVKDAISALNQAYRILIEIFEKINKHQLISIDLVKEIDDFNTFKLPTDLECPVGVPFAAYTVELGAHVVVDVVEGQAWVEGRKETDAEVTATEIVSQMLVERGLNPKAPTRIAVREVDPRFAHEQRAAEARGGPPRVRTIKFHVAPPRYLREAAEQILSSHVRAHWVVGHWRNQPFGEGRKQHHQTWIKPHIRGLGDAGATTTKITAQKGRSADAQKPEGTERT